MADLGSVPPYQPVLFALFLWGLEKCPMYTPTMDPFKLKYQQSGGGLSPPVMDFSEFPTHFTPQGSSSPEISGSDEKEKNGFEYEFVTKIDEKYECPICCYALRNPNQTKCGHRFCSSCIRRWIREQTRPGVHSSCPICSSELTDVDLFEDNFAKREILCLKIFCPNREEGCSTVIELRNVDKHLSVCVYVLVKCPFSCGKWMLRKDIEEHQKTSCERRKIKCEVCAMEVTIDNKKSHLEAECPMVEVECSYCKQKYKRRELEAHTENECPKLLVDCVFKIFGCSTRVDRDQLDTHLEINTQAHLKMVADVVEKLRINQPAVSEFISSLAGKGGSIIIPPTPASADLPFQQTATSRTPSPTSIPVGKIHPLERDLMAPYVRGSHHRYTHPIADSLSLNMSTGYSDPLPSTSRQPLQQPLEHWPNLPHDRSLRRQVSLGSARNGSRGGDLVGSATVDLAPLIENHRDLERRFSDQQQQLLTMRSQLVSMGNQLQKQEETIQTFEARNCDGKYLWKIDNYGQKKVEAQRGQRTVIHSPGFHTSMFGYKLCVRLNINGVESATGTHISLFVHFMQGEYDDVLDWPFAGRIALAIMDQTEGTLSRQNITETLISKPNLAAFQRPRSHRNHKGFGYVEFCPISLIEGSVPQYLKNDTIFIQVKVELN